MVTSWLNLEEDRMLQNVELRSNFEKPLLLLRNLKITGTAVRNLKNEKRIK